MIKDRNIDPGANISIDKLAFPNIISGKHTDGSLPKIVWVAKGGADADGSTGVARVGGRDEPFLTANGANGAFRYTVDGRGDRVILGPGIYRETWDFGSGTGTTGTAGRMNKRDIGVYGSGGAHPGRTQIVGDGTLTTPTIRVQSGYLRGFTLSNLEIGSVTTGDADRALVGLELTTSDAGTLTATSNDEWAVLNGVRLDGGAVGTIGLALTGTTMLRAYNLEVSGWLEGIAFMGSVNNMPDHCHFWDTLFQDNVTADIATVGGGSRYDAVPLIVAVALTNITFMRPVFKDRGGTPVTNYINSVGTHVNVGFYEFVSARDVALNTLMALAVDDIAIGRSAASAEFIIGA